MEVPRLLLGANPNIYDNQKLINMQWLLFRSYQKYALVYLDIL